MPLIFSLLLAVNIISPNLSQSIVSTIPTPQDVWMQALAQRESGGDDKIKVLDVDGYYSYGRYNYHMSTWLKYSKLFGTTKENIYDGTLQDAVTRYILDTKGSSDWYNSTKYIENVLKLGPYPSEVSQPLDSSVAFH